MKIERLFCLNITLTATNLQKLFGETLERFERDVLHDEGAAHPERLGRRVEGEGRRFEARHQARQVGHERRVRDDFERGFLCETTENDSYRFSKQKRRNSSLQSDLDIFPALTSF